MKWALGPAQLLLLEGEHSFLLIGRALRSFSLYIESREQEFVQGVRPDDLVVVSSPEGGSYEPARMLLELVRTYHTPLVVLPRDHPGTKRLKLVVAVAPRVTTSCTIVRGTHPEQHLLCSSDELAGLCLKGEEGYVLAENIPPGAVVRYLPLSREAQ
ncbi:MAG: alpha/beta hydrolase [Methanomicrobiales archaeon]|nr:alpha/beta hydrolase [Methanomicrobiales archaeon]